MKKDQTAAIFEESTLPDLKARAERGDSSGLALPDRQYRAGSGHGGADICAGKDLRRVP